MMREAQFLTVFAGIETPDADALKAMRKEHNNAVPIMQAISTLNDYGLEVTSGIILGLDTDSAETESRLNEFVDLSNIPILTMNLLQALPKTPLWDRLNAHGRIADDASLESNVRFLRPYDEVVAMWRRCVAHAYDPERLFARFKHQIDATYVNRKRGRDPGKLTLANLRSAAVLLFRLVLHVGAARSTRCSASAWSRITSSCSRARRSAVPRTRRSTRRMRARRRPRWATCRLNCGRPRRCSRPRRRAPRPKPRALRQRVVQHHHLADRLRGDEADELAKVVDHGDRGRGFLLQDAERLVEAAARSDGRHVRGHRLADSGVGPEVLERADEVVATEHADRLAGAVDDRAFALARAQESLHRLIDMRVGG